MRKFMYLLVFGIAAVLVYYVLSVKGSNAEKASIGETSTADGWRKQFK